MKILGNRVLIVDDERNMRHMLQTMLNKEGYVAETASNGAEALSTMDEGDFDFILCDIKMPKMDGLEFLRRLMPQHPLPVVMVSSMTAPGAKATLDALDAGAVFSLSPVRPSMECAHQDSYREDGHERFHETR